MGEDPRPRHVHDTGPDGCFEVEVHCDVPTDDPDHPHEHDFRCGTTRTSCGYRGLY